MKKVLIALGIILGVILLVFFMFAGTNNTAIGLEEQINSIKESHDYLFDSDKPLPTFTGANPNNNPNFNNKELSLGEALKEKFK